MRRLILLGILLFSYSAYAADPTSTPTQVTCGNTVRIAQFGDSFQLGNGCAAGDTGGINIGLRPWLIDTLQQAYGKSAYMIGTDQGGNRLTCNKTDSESGSITGQILVKVRTAVPTYFTTPTTNDVVILGGGTAAQIVGETAAIISANWNTMMDVVNSHSPAINMVLVNPAWNPSYAFTFTNAAWTSSLAYGQAMGYRIAGYDPHATLGEDADNVYEDNLHPKIAAQETMGVELAAVLDEEIDNTSTVTPTYTNTPLPSPTPACSPQILYSQDFSAGTVGTLLPDIDPLWSTPNFGWTNVGTLACNILGAAGNTACVVSTSGWGGAYMTPVYSNVSISARIKLTTGQAYVYWNSEGPSGNGGTAKNGYGVGPFPAEKIQLYKTDILGNRNSVSMSAAVTYSGADFKLKIVTNSVGGQEIYMNDVLTLSYTDGSPWTAGKIGSNFIFNTFVFDDVLITSFVCPPTPTPTETPTPAPTSAMPDWRRNRKKHLDLRLNNR